MLKIFRNCGTSYEMGDPVKIDNTVRVPVEENEEIISVEELERIEANKKAEEERRFIEAVDERLRHILAERSEALGHERDAIIEQAQKKATSIAADAKAATMAVMEKAQRECIILKEQARKEGYNEGYADGKNESLDKYKKYIDAAGKLLSEINSRKDAYYISNEDELRETVMEMVKKIVRAEMKSNPEAINCIIAEAAKKFRNSDYLKITLAEEEITEKFKTDEKLVREIIPFISDIELEFDEDAAEGTIILDNGSEIVDAGVPTQLDFLREILNNTRGKMVDDE